MIGRLFSLSYRTARMVPAFLQASLCALTLIHSRPSDALGGRQVPMDRVEFLPGQTATYPIGTLAPVVAVNLRNDTLVAAVGAYTLSVPIGLIVFVDEAGTIPMSAGMMLTTNADGRDTLWVTGTATATADRSYVLSIPGTQPTVMLTFRVPPLGLSQTTTGALQDPVAGEARNPRDVLGRRGVGLNNGRLPLRLFPHRD